MDNCLECGKPIPWRPGIKNRERAKFCGNPCKFAYQRAHPARPRMPRTTRPCATCGVPVTFLPSQRGPDSRSDRSPNIYCSRKCKGIGHSKIMTGRRPSNGVYASRHVFRQMMRLLFHDRCAICGWAEAPCDVCHIVARRGDPSRDDPQNITMLCPNHHRMFDRGLIPVDEVRATRANVLR